MKFVHSRSLTTLLLPAPMLACGAEPDASSDHMLDEADPTAELVSGNPAAAVTNPSQPASATWRLSGLTPQLCSDQDGVLADSGEFSGPKRPPVCSDLASRAASAASITRQASPA